MDSWQRKSFSPRRRHLPDVQQRAQIFRDQEEKEHFILKFQIALAGEENEEENLCGKKWSII